MCFFGATAAATHSKELCCLMDWLTEPDTTVDRVRQELQVGTLDQAMKRILVREAVGRASGHSVCRFQMGLAERFDEAK
jgi:hypothetical protein